MNKGKTVTINNQEYTFTAEESKVKKLRGYDIEIGAELKISVFDVNKNRKLSVKEIRKLDIDKYLAEFSKDAFNGLHLTNYSLSDIECRYKILVQEKLNLEEDITRIKIQLDTAKDQYKNTGVQTDLIWYRKASSALAMKQLELKKLNTEEMNLRNDRKKKRAEENIKANNTRSKIFEDVAYKLLDKDTIDKIVKETNEILKNYKE